MRTVILDENVPHLLRHLLAPHEVVTVKYQGWAGVKNGELIELIDGRFEVFVTGDKNLRYQQDLRGRKIAIVELPSTAFVVLESLLPIIIERISSAEEGDYICV